MLAEVDHIEEKRPWTLDLLPYLLLVRAASDWALTNGLLKAQAAPLLSPCWDPLRKARAAGEVAPQ